MSETGTGPQAEQSAAERGASALLDGVIVNVDPDTGEVLEPTELEPVEPGLEPTEPTEPEPEQPQEPQQPRDDREIEALYTKLETKAKNYTKAIGELLTGSGVPVTPCELCYDCYPGIRWIEPRTETSQQMVMVAVGSAGLDDLQDDPDAQICEKCGGFGAVKLPSHVAGNMARTCRGCNGAGYVELHPQSGTPQPPQADAPNGEVEPYAGVPTEDPAVRDLIHRGFTVIPPMQTITTTT